MISFYIHRFKLHLDWTLKPSKTRRKLIRKYGDNFWAMTYTNKYWKRKADRLRARFRDI